MIPYSSTMYSSARVNGNISARTARNARLCSSQKLIARGVVFCFFKSFQFSFSWKFLVFFQVGIIYEPNSFYNHIQGHENITYKLLAEVFKSFLHFFTLHFCLLLCSDCLTQEGVTDLEAVWLQKKQRCSPHKLHHYFREHVFYTQKVVQSNSLALFVLGYHVEKVKRKGQEEKMATLC